ncbi:MAG TPA: hypothetical protein VGW74_02545, partial [Propionibacteriaceae bacterium]|nr:hypothetical protein [Propionibacteriaceae bacterium]
SWTVDTDGMALRSISAARLRRVDLTIEPYYPDSTAEMAYRSLAEQTGLELRSLVEAADRGELASLILHPEDEETDDGRETTVVRHPTYY